MTFSRLGLSGVPRTPLNVHVRRAFSVGMYSGSSKSRKKLVSQYLSVMGLVNTVCSVDLFIQLTYDHWHCNPNRRRRSLSSRLHLGWLYPPRTLPNMHVPVLPRARLSLGGELEVTIRRIGLMTRSLYLPFSLYPPLHSQRLLNLVRDPWPANLEPPPKQFRRMSFSNI